MKAATTGSMILASTLLSALPAWSHAMPRQTTPTSGAVLSAPPKQVSILFDENVQPGANRIDVRENGKVVNEGKGTQDAKHPRLLKVALKNPGKGKYHVTWRALAQDGHVSRGTFDFSVK